MKRALPGTSMANPKSVLVCNRENGEDKELGYGCGDVFAGHRINSDSQQYSLLRVAKV